MLQRILGIFLTLFFAVEALAVSPTMLRSERVRSLDSPGSVTLDFADVPLAEVARTLSRAYGTSILTDDAVVVMADDVDMAHITIEKTGEDSMIRVQCDRTGTSLFEIVDGDRTYRYEIKIFGNGNQAAQVEIIPQESSPDE